MIIRPIHSLVLVIAIVFAPQPSRAMVNVPQTPDAVAGEYIMKVEGASTGFRKALQASEFTYIEELPFGYHLVRDQKARDTSTAFARLHDLGASEAQPNFIKRIALAKTTTGQNDQWALDNPATGADIRAPAAWNYLRTIPGADRKVRVAVIDSGIDREAPEFAGRIDFNSSYNFVGGNTNLQDYAGHGTHVSGIIGASHSSTSRIKGVNPNVEFVVLKAFTMYGFAPTGTVLKALNAALKANVRIINASYSSPSFDKAEYAALERIQRAGILFVAAAGNDGSDTDKKPLYPADYDLSNIVSVGASTRVDQPATFSNYGATTVDVFAPGADILSTMVDVSFVSPKKVYELDMQDTRASEWKTNQATDVGLATGPWNFEACGDIAGSCLKYRPTSDYTPSAKFDFFNYKHLESIPSNPEKRFIAVLTTKYTIPAVDLKHRVTGSVMAGGNENWVMAANYTSGKKGWTTERYDISKPHLFYSGTTAWTQFILGFSMNYSSMQGYSEYQSTEMVIKKIALETEDPLAKSALASWSGTSMATPHVVGIASWMIAKDPSLTLEQIRKKLIAACDPVASMKSKAICAGRVNFDTAVRP